MKTSDSQFFLGAGDPPHVPRGVGGCRQDAPRDRTRAAEAGRRPGRRAAQALACMARRGHPRPPRNGRCSGGTERVAPPSRAHASSAADECGADGDDDMLALQNESAIAASKLSLHLRMLSNWRTSHAGSSAWRRKTRAPLSEGNRPTIERQLSPIGAKPRSVTDLHN